MSVLQLLDKKIIEIPKALYPKLTTKIKKKINLKPRLLISVSNNRVSSLLSNKKISAIINQLGDNFDFDITISCLEIDYERALNLQKQIIQQSIVNLSPTLPLFIYLLRESDICFFGDGGSMHIAAALGIHQVVLFGETSETTWAPISEKAIVLRDDLDVNNIPEAQIFEALKKKLTQVSS